MLHDEQEHDRRAAMSAERRASRCAWRGSTRSWPRSSRPGARDGARGGGRSTRSTRFDVPGAFELPLVAKYAAESGRYAAVVCLGAVIRGETDHYDYVCGEAARGIQQVQLATGVPCGFGVLTVDTMEQALDAGHRRRQARHRPPRGRGGAGLAGGQAASSPAGAAGRLRG